MQKNIIYITLLLTTICFGQIDSPQVKAIKKRWAETKFTEMYPNYEAQYNYTIKDEILELTFKVDSTETIVEATNRSGNIIWATDPWKDNELPIYRHNRPVITHFKIRKNDIPYTMEKWSSQQEVIEIWYSSSQFGYLNKQTGEFIFMGQD